jgi:hypothetical protein
VAVAIPSPRTSDGAISLAALLDREVSISQSSWHNISAHQFLGMQLFGRLTRNHPLAHAHASGFKIDVMHLPTHDGSTKAPQLT